MSTDNGVCTVLNINASDVYVNKSIDLIGVIDQLADYSNFTTLENPRGAGKALALRLILTAPPAVFAGRRNKGKFKVGRLSKEQHWKP